MNPIILLIEDDEMRRDKFGEMLEYEEFNVIGAEDGLMGLQLAKDIQPDLILCDINMSKINGYDLFQKIREDARTKKTPFIFLTESDEGKKGQGIDLGANDYVNKNANFTKLMQAIARKLDAVYC